jgi:hypothetical protein
VFMLASTMDDQTKHRKERLQALIDGKPYLGSKSAFAARAGLSKGRITQLLDPAEAFGERSARNITAALGLRDERYFERPFSEAPQEEETRSEPGEVEGAIRVLADAMKAADAPTRAAVAPLFALLAQEPERLESIASTLMRLIPERILTARNLQEDQREGQAITALLPSLANKEQQGAKRSPVQNRGRS